MDVSAIIVNWNTRDVLHDCLRSIYEEAGNIGFEVIVVDNASVDGSCDMVRTVFPEVILIVNDSNRGYAAALNQGMKIAQGRYFLVLNSDVLICDRAVEKTLGYADAHPEVGVVGCQVYEDLAQRDVQMTCFRFPSIFNLVMDTFALSRIFKKNRLFGREWMLWWHRDTERRVDVVSGMFMLVKQEAIDQVGLMDEAYFLLWEETDWCYRFAEAGWKRMFWPGARIIHMHGGSQSRKKANLKMMVQFRKSTLIFYNKHHSWIEYLLVRLLLAVHCGLRCIVWGGLKMFKKLMGKEFTFEASKMLGFWWSFKFCVSGCELETEAQNKL